ncbi:excisionase family DNA binding protein [Bradyrhizobium sp. USDA 4011]
MAKSAKKRATPVAAPTTATMTIDEAAKRLRIGRNQAYEAVHRGDLPVIKIGKRLLIPTAALDRMLGEIA